MEQFRGFSPCPLRVMDKLPGSPGARRARAVVEHTRKPGGLPRPERRGHLRAGTPAPARGERGRQVSERPRRYTHPPKKPNQKAIWFGFCFALIFNTYARLDIAHSQAPSPPRRAQNGPQRPKSLSMPKLLLTKKNGRQSW